MAVVRRSRGGHRWASRISLRRSRRYRWRVGRRRKNLEPQRARRAFSTPFQSRHDPLRSMKHTEQNCRFQPENGCGQSGTVFTRVRRRGMVRLSSRLAFEDSRKDVPGIDYVQALFGIRVGPLAKLVLDGARRGRCPRGRSDFVLHLLQAMKQAPQLGFRGRRRIAETGH